MMSAKSAVILGPGANIKRSPLCGRNFEYFSKLQIGSPSGEIQDHPAGKAFVEAVAAGAGQAFGGGALSGDLKRMIEAMMIDMPLRGVMMMGGNRVTPEQVEGLLGALNGQA